ncbi:unnamed protein product [Brassica oleracea]|uniref:(rape) hypothetical protein n=1 Tax=Brassica napus TaxID=3708 RepID=A0A816J0G0_BRANA|nr:unnamed protein product [Brassica napus]
MCCCSVGDSSFSAVASAKSIVLELHSRVCSHRTSLKTLKLLDCYKVGDESVSSLAQFCKNLETLIIGGCRDISDESIILLADSCRDGLKNLRMDWQVTCQSSVDCRECTNLLVDSAHCHLGELSFEYLVKINFLKDASKTQKKVRVYMRKLNTRSPIPKSTLFGTLRNSVVFVY